MSNTRRIGVEAARVNLTKVLREAGKSNSTLLIAFHGRPLGVVIPVDSTPTIIQYKNGSLRIQRAQRPRKK